MQVALVARCSRFVDATPDFKATDLTHCARCGHSTTAGYWLLDGQPVHARCADWASRPYPYVWAVDLARRLVHKAPQDVELRAAARLVWEMGRRWPHGAVELLERAAPAVLTLTMADQRLRAS